MSAGKIEYLERYSVAPSPSRDYYGLKVHQDQVTLYLWRISHGPHKTPIVRTCSFADFLRDKQLQDEIRRVFGKYLSRHVKNIASGRSNTLLTLPKCLIERLIRYLTVDDVAKLSLLSHVAKEIFNDNLVWEALYKRYKPLTKRKYEKLDTTRYNWKQLFQQAQMQGLMNEHRVPRARTATRQTKAAPKVEDSTRTIGFNSKPSLKIPLAENQVQKKSLENVRKKNLQNTVPRKLSDSRLRESTMEKEKIPPEKRTSAIRSLQVTGQRNMRILRAQSSVTKTESKREIEGKESVGVKASEGKSIRTQSKARKIDSKTSGTSIKMPEEREAVTVKSRHSIAPRTNRNEKLASRVTQEEQNKSKTRGKAKRIGQSKSTILSTNTALLDAHSTVKDDSFDLADLIAASLKNMRSPRSIFDSNFSCIEKAKSCGGDAKVHESSRKMTEHSRGGKNGQAKATLDRLSEKSEPLTAKSEESANKSDASCGFATPKHTKTGNIEARKEPSKYQCNVTRPEDKIDYLERYGIYNKYAAQETQESNDQKRSTVSKTIDKMNILRSLGTKHSYRKTGVGAAAEVNRYELRKAAGNLYK